MDGIGETARRYVHALVAATLRTDLSHLTLLPFEQLLSPVPVFRRVRAWCALCYEDARTSGAIVYDLLLWAIRIVEVCPRHERPLDERCPHCHRSFHPSMANSQPGYCSFCEQWLGMPVAPVGPPTGFHVTHADSRLWIAKAVSELLAAGPQMQACPLGETVCRNLRVYADDLVGGNIAALAAFARCKPKFFYHWLEKDRLPIGRLFRVCHQLNISIASLLSTNRPDANFLSECAKVIQPQPERRGMRKHHPDLIRRALQDALHEDPAPSLTKVARRLQYKSRAALYRVDPVACKQIIANHSRSKRSCWWFRSGAVPICSTEKIKQRLEDSLARDEPMSPHQIAGRLGYSSSSTISKRFPELCRAISAKIRQQRKARIEGIKLALESALQEDPPPSLSAMSRRLGYLDASSLRDLAPDLCDTLLARRKAYEHGRLQAIRIKLEAALTEEPPLSLATVWKRFGVSVDFLQKHFGDLCKAIIANYEQRSQETTRMRKQALEKEVRQIMATLGRMGVVPSVRRVKALVKRKSLNDRKTLHWAIKKARQEQYTGM